MTDTPVKIRCDACPVMCYVAEGRLGACDRYANKGGKIIRCDPLTILDHRIAAGDEVKPFLGADWQDDLDDDSQKFVTAIGSGTTYPDYKPAPFIISQQVPTPNHRHIVRQSSKNDHTCIIIPVLPLIWQ
jgi:hypothetical protein